MSPALIDGGLTEDTIFKEEEEARRANAEAEAAALSKQQRKPQKPPGKRTAAKDRKAKADRETKARELDELLMKSAAFSDILTKKTQVLGRVGSSLDGKSLGEHNLEMARQPRCMVGGTMRDYQLEGLTWMYEICSQGMSGILADEMGLGKTVQTISLIALLREQEDYLGPHLIVAPLSTLSNWIDEFHRWTPSIPVVMFHGTKAERDAIYADRLRANLAGGRPTDRFPVVCTSYEMVLREQANLSKINWEFIIIDEGHRMKNAEAKLFQQLRQFSSATRLLITGTPLQNNLKELWSLLHFLLPTIFTDWDAFESWFDFSALQDEQGTEDFIGDQMKHQLVKKIHLILQPLLLRRVKQDVAAYLPRKREYVLFAPMTKEQTDLYNVISDKEVDTRAFLESKVVEKIEAVAAKELEEKQLKEKKAAEKQAKQAEPKRSRSTRKAAETTLPVRESPRKAKAQAVEPSPKPAKNAFSLLMGKRGTDKKQAKDTPSKLAAAAAENGKRAVENGKRKAPTSAASDSKSAKSSRQSTPGSTRSGRTRPSRTYKEADSDEEQLSDDEFEAKLATELDAPDTTDKPDLSPAEAQKAQTLDLARKQIGRKKLGNPLAQLRLVCNSPHNFYNPWSIPGPSGDFPPPDETLVTSSGKMLMLDRLLPALLAAGHKVLIFSQFTTQLDLLHDYCTSLRGWPTCRIDGSVSQDSRRAQIAAFNADPSHAIFLLSTRAGGQGINLASADSVILFDSDFNPQQDLQAQDRAHRIGQTRPVVVYRLATRGTVEENLLTSADAKRRLEKLVIRKGTFRTMGQKMDHEAPGDDADQLDEDTLRSLLLKDGHVYQSATGDGILSDEDLAVLCDRSDEAYDRAAAGHGDAHGFRVVETGADSITMARKD